jgi:hypothetical protein
VNLGGCAARELASGGVCGPHQGVHVIRAEKSDGIF